MHAMCVSTNLGANLEGMFARGSKRGEKQEGTAKVKEGANASSGPVRGNNSSYTDSSKSECPQGSKA